MVAREDRKLPVTDRVALHLHLMTCKACPRFEKQMLTISSSMRQWREYSRNDSDSIDQPKKNGKKNF